MSDQESIERCKELIKPEHANWIGITNQLAIETIIKKYEKQQSELEKKDKEIKEIRQKIHFKICSNCKEEFESKRSDAIYCKKCSKKVNNSNYYKNLNEEQKTIRREKAKEKMREIRKRRKVKDGN